MEVIFLRSRVVNMLLTEMDGIEARQVTTSKGPGLSTCADPSRRTQHDAAVNASLQPMLMRRACI